MVTIAEKNHRVIILTEKGIGAQGNESKGGRRRRKLDNLARMYKHDDSSKERVN